MATIRIHWSGGPTLQANAAWTATLAGLIGYWFLQATALVFAIAAFGQRVTGNCLSAPACELVETWSGGFVGFVSILIGLLSLVILSALARLIVATRRRQGWVGVLIRIIGGVTALGGLVTVLGWGWPWLIVGLWLGFWSKRLRFETGHAAAKVPGPLQP